MSQTPAPNPQTPAPGGRWFARPDGSARPIGVWLILLGLLVAVCFSMVARLGRPDVFNRQEAQALAIATETLDRQSSLSRVGPMSLEYWVPQTAGVPSPEVPPATVWLQVTAFRVSDALNGSVSPGARARSARAVSVVLGLLTLAAVYWAGQSLGGTRVGLLAALICAASPLFLWHARLATPAMLYTCCWTLAIAGALWALRPLRPAPSASRQALGWTICGVGTAMALMTVGPGAYLSIGLPVLLFVFLCPSRVSHGLGLAAAMLIGSLIVVPWTIFVFQMGRETLGSDLALLIPPHWLSARLLLVTVLERAWWLPVALGPWLLWMGGAVVQPFSSSVAGARVRMFLGWSMFMVALVVTFGASEAEWWACLACCVPALGLLLAQLFQHYSERAEQGRFPRSWRVARWPHAALMLLLPLGVGWLLYNPGIPVMVGLMGLPAWSAPSLWLVWVIGLIGTGLAVAAAHQALTDYPGTAMAFWAGACWVLLLLAALSLSEGPGFRTPLRAEGARVTQLAEGGAVFRLAPPRGEQADPTTDYLSFYGMTPIVPVPQNRVGLLPDVLDRFVLLAPTGYQPPDMRLENLGPLPASGLNAWGFGTEPLKRPAVPVPPDPAPEAPLESDQTSL